MPSERSELGSAPRYSELKSELYRTYGACYRASEVTRHAADAEGSVATVLYLLLPYRGRARLTELYRAMQLRELCVAAHQKQLA